MDKNEYIKLQMSADDIINNIKRDSESTVYLDNIMEKYPQEFNNFVNKLANLEIDGRILGVLAKEENPLNTVRKYSIDIVIHRLRQISCFGNPTKEYVEDVFNATIEEISFK